MVDSVKPSSSRARKRAELEPWQRDDAQRLMRAWQQFQRLRRDAGDPVSQAWLGQHCGMNQSAVSFYLNGVNALNLEALLKFAAAIEVEPAAISPTIAQRMFVIEQPRAQYSVEALRVAAAIDAMDEPRRKALLTTLDMLLQKPVEDVKVEKAFKTNERPRVKGELSRPTLFNDDFTGPRRE